MRCTKVQKAIMEYQESDRRLDGDSRLAKHIQNCPECKEFAKDYRKTRELCKQAKQVVPIRSEFLDSLNDIVVEKTSDKPSSIRRPKRILVPVSIASAAAILMAVVLYSGVTRDTNKNGYDNYISRILSVEDATPLYRELTNYLQEMPLEKTTELQYLSPGIELNSFDEEIIDDEDIAFNGDNLDPYIMLEELDNNQREKLYHQLESILKNMGNV